MKYLKLLVALLCLHFSNAQSNRSTSIVVFNAVTNEAVPFASITCLKTNVTAVANGSGITNMLCSIEDSIRITAIGFKTVTVANMQRVALQPADDFLNDIVVSASRSAQRRIDAPIAISKISAATIANTKPKDVFELLNKVSGVVMSNFNNEQHGMSIRQPMANLSPYFLYLEDGLPVRTMGIFNHNALIEMNVPAIQSIEVIKGPASSIYGPEAIGGSVNFIQLKPTVVTQLKAGIQADNYGYYRVHATASGAINKKLGYALAVNRTQQTDGWIINSDYTKNAYLFRLDYALSNKTKLWASYNQIDYDSQTSGSVDSIAFYSRKYTSTTDFTYRKVFAKRARVTLEHQWNENHQTMITAFWRDNEIAQNPTFTVRWVTGRDSAQNEVNNNQFTSRGIVAQHTAGFKWLQSKLIAGASIDNSPNRYYANLQILNAILRPDRRSVERYTVRQLYNDRFIANYSANLFNAGLWLQGELSPIKNMKLVAGLRYDRLTFDYTSLPTITQTTTASGTKTYNQINPRIALSYKVTKQVSVYANYAKGFAPASLSTLFNPQNPQGLNLAPATFDSYEVGAWAALYNSKLLLDIALYQNKGNNEVVSVRQPDNSTVPTSSGATLHRGIELGITYKISKSLEVRYSGTVALHRFENFVLSTRASDAIKNVNGKIMPQSPAYMANTEVTFKPSWLKGFRVAAEWQYMSSWYQNQINTIRYNDKGFLGARCISLLHIRAGYTYQRFEVFTNIMNVTNELYANTATVGNAVTDRTTYNPGAPFIINIGIQYAFTGK
jgi:outer membrane receptor protein involved in Fe transport